MERIRPGITHGQLYHFQADGPHDPESGQWFNGQARLIDPCAKALSGHFQESYDGIIRPPKCVVIDDQYDWEGDRHVRRDLSETVIYEMNVRGFTKNPNSGVFFFQAEDGIRDLTVTGVQTCALPI